MLKRVDQPGSEAPDVEVPTSKPIDFDLLMAVARRQLRVLAASALVALFLGFIYIVTAVPLYTATTDLFIDSQKNKNDVASTIAELTFDTGAIDSQVEVLKSEKIALAVIAAMHLTADPEFIGIRGTLIGQAWGVLRSAFDFRSWFVSREKADPEKEYDLERSAADQLKDNLEVHRVARTYVLALDYTSPNSAKAAAIANAFAEAYLTEQLDAKYDATRRASGWLQARMGELKEKSLAADFAIQKFKADKGLITADGKLVTDQQLTELNTQLAQAHSETAKAESRYAQITQLVNSGQTDGAVPDSLANPVINDLRQKFLNASKTEAELAIKLGSSHLAVVNLRNQMAEYRRQIFEELKRIAQSYQSDAEVARVNEKALNTSMTGLVGANAVTNQTLVELRELERESETYRSLYQNFLQRYQESVQQQSFPITEARVITAATTPRSPSFPKRGLIMTLSLFMGLLCGAGIGALREHRDRVFRVASQVRDELGLEFLGMLPAVRHPVVSTELAGEELERQIRSTDSLQRYSIDHPLSSFSETLRAIKVAADVTLGDRSKIIGVISVLPNEGKSTVSKNFASLLAHLGARTLLIDGDLRNPGLTRAIASHAEAGVLEAIRDPRPMEGLLLFEPESNLWFLPTVVRKRVQHSSELLSSAGMRNLLAAAGEAFDYVVIDLPPLGPVVDVRAAASMFDGFVFVIEWGRTARGMVQTILTADETLYDKCIGAVFNKVPMSKIGLYESYGSKDYYYRRYSKYYHHAKEPA
jgi:succinoglycan biosynthesis transport protein ExoP